VVGERVKSVGDESKKGGDAVGGLCEEDVWEEGL